MIHARNDYARIQDPDKKIPGDEPVFLLRAQDETAAKVVRFWAELNKGNEPLAGMARAQADLMDAWPVKHTADLPKNVNLPPLDIEDQKNADASSDGSEPGQGS
jgi:hypothetical protein